MKKNSGVTLLELILAMSIMSLIMFAGGGIYLSGVNLSKNAHYSTQAHRNAMIAIAHIRKYASEAASGFKVEDDGKKVTFNVYNDSPDFSNPPPINRVYTYSPGELKYTSTNGDDVTLSNISDCKFETTDGLLLKVTITAEDSSGLNDCTVSTNIEASYASKQ